MQVLFEGFPGLGVGRLVGNIGVFLVARALVVLRPVRLPVSQAHPTEVMLTMITLHVVATPVLLDANITLGAL